jgi:hypothetical protein
MFNLLKVHFDEFMLALLLLIMVGVWIWHPDAKEWVGSLLAALIMAFRNSGKTKPSEEDKQ